MERPPAYRVRERNDLDICKIVTDGKRLYIEGHSAYTGVSMDSFKRKHCRTVGALFTALGQYVHMGVIKSFHVRRKA
ncbi:hypothetical protein KLI54_23580 [Bacillus thuringiensis]|uniref:hypothetical protein n=1 Tax=Bacillus thuringiensis TaxID=1428 RepID=UPI0013988C6B|nr:hypothetical protein [Bacillus thuringiensis]MBT2201223.1 hypothetical protein [Bacillus thuringiensis]BCA37359.1 hypothetical protein BwiPL1_57410 [Bacillus wiedmannii]